MQKRITAFFMIMVAFAVAFFSMSDYCQAYNKTARATRTVRVGYYDSPSFMNGAYYGAQKSGYGYDYLQEIANLADWKYEYVYGEWSELLHMLERGEIDLLPEVSYTPERAEKLAFPEQVMGKEEYYIFVPLEENEISPTDYSTLNGRSIGIDSSSIERPLLERWLAEHQVSCNIVEYEYDSLRRKDNHLRKIDASVEENMAVNDKLTPIAKIGESSYYLAVSRTKPVILAELNHALSDLKRTRPFFIEELYQRYYAGRIVPKGLTYAEHKWFFNHTDRIRVGLLRDNMPFSGQNTRTGEQIGAIRDLFTVFLPLLQIHDKKVEYVYFDSQHDMEEALYHYRADVIFPIPTEADNYRERMMVSAAVKSMPMQLIFKEDYVDTAVKSLAVVEGSVGKQLADVYYPSSERMPYATVEECINAVYNGFASAALANSYMTSYYLTGRSKYKGMKAISLPKPLFLSMAVRREDPELLAVINRGLSILPRERIDGMISRQVGEKMNYNESAFLTDYSLEIIAIFILFVMVMIALYIALRSRLKQKEFSRKLEFANEDLEEMVKEERWLKAALEESYEAADQANRAKSSFLSAMSHDIRTPMNGILGMATIAEKHLTEPERVADCLKKIKGAGAHLLGLINNVLDMSKIESGKLELVPEDFDLRDLLGNLEAMVRPQINEHHHTLTVDISAVQHTALSGDDLKLQQIFTNLLSNAIKYTPDGGELSVRAVEKELEQTDLGCFVFYFKDNGMGMSEEYQAKVFEPFTRAEGTTVNKIQGTGLGMPIARNIARMMGGDITVRSELGKGTEFTVTVYLQKRAAEAAAAAAEQAEAADITELNFAGKRVLLVEDNELNLEIAMELIAMTGVSIDPAENGQVAVDKVRDNEPYDLVLMDIQMPVLNGYEATAAIRALGTDYVRNLPIIAMTANAFAEDVKRAEEAGMNGHLAKPIDMKALAQILVKYLS